MNRTIKGNKESIGKVKRQNKFLRGKGRMKLWRMMMSSKCHSMMAQVNNSTVKKDRKRYAIAARLRFNLLLLHF
jgi:hypothetical protein